MALASVRASTSEPSPAVAGTTILIGFTGYCAVAVALANKVARMALRKSRCKFMGDDQGVRKQREQYGETWLAGVSAEPQPAARHRLANHRLFTVGQCQQRPAYDAADLADLLHPVLGVRLWCAFWP